jgi:hypothetical protein
MSLPVRELPTGRVDIDGTYVDIRSLSRAEALALQDYRGREDEAEVVILVAGTGCTEAEAQTWRESTDTRTAGLLIDAILELSGLVEGIDPKPPSNGP